MSKLTQTGKMRLLAILPEPLDVLVIAGCIKAAIQRNDGVMAKSLALLSTDALSELIVLNEIDAIEWLNANGFEEIIARLLGRLDPSQKETLAQRLIEENRLLLFPLFLQAASLVRLEGYLLSAMRYDRRELINELTSNQNLIGELLRKKQLPLLESLESQGYRNFSDQLKAYRRSPFVWRRVEAAPPLPLVVHALPANQNSYQKLAEQVLRGRLDLCGNDIQRELLIKLLEDYKANFFFRFHWLHRYTQLVAEVLQLEAELSTGISRMTVDDILGTLAFKIKKSVKAGQPILINPNGSLMQCLIFFDSKFGTKKHEDFLTTLGVQLSR